MATKAGSKGGRKIGRDKKKGERYRGANTRNIHKIKKILKSNGLTFATEWAVKHGMLKYIPREE